MQRPRQRRRRWRFYETSTGRRPVREFLEKLPDDQSNEIAVAMHQVTVHGTQVARHLRGEVYELRIGTADVIFRVLFAEEGRYSQVLLALEAFSKKTQKTPPPKIELAERRLADWRSRARLRVIK